MIVGGHVTLLYSFVMTPSAVSSYLDQAVWVIKYVFSFHRPEQREVTFNEEKGFFFSCL